MRIEKNKLIITTSDCGVIVNREYEDGHIILSSEPFSSLQTAINYSQGYTATHGRVTATAPTMWEAIALCTNGVYQAKFIKSNE